MFRLSERLSRPRARRADARRYVKRALLFGAGLLLLWVALQLLPSHSTPVQPRVYSDSAGTVAARADAPSSGVPSFLSAGNVAAALLLGGGVALAVYLRRKTGDGGGTAPIKSVGELAIGPNQSLRLVECGSDLLLLGVTSGQINLLRLYPLDAFQLPEPASPADLPARNARFAHVLRQYAGQHGRVETRGSTC